MSRTAGSTSRTDPVQGTLTAMILKAVSWQPLHGYAIARWIEGASDKDLLVQEGSLYPALRRLEDGGLIESDWTRSETNRRVKTYSLTDRGRRHLDDESSRWAEYAAAVSRVLERETP